MSKEEIEEFLEEVVGSDATDILLPDGFERAFVGAALDPPRAIFSIDLCVKTLIDQGRGQEDAEEYFWFNMAGSHMGDNTPLFIYTLT